MVDRTVPERPDETLIASYLEGQLDGADRDRVEAWLVEDDELRRDFPLMRKVLAGEGEDTVPLEVLSRVGGRTFAGKVAGRRRAFHARWFTAVAAASVVLTLFGSWLFYRPDAGTPKNPVPVFRQGGLHAGADLYPAANSTLAVYELFFQWQPVEGAEWYRVVIWRPDGGCHLELRVHQEPWETEWPENEPGPAPGAYFWKLEAWSLGRIVHETYPIPFEVHP